MCDVTCLLVALGAIAILVLMLISVMLYLTSHAANLARHDSEKYFWMDKTQQKKQAFPSLSEAASLDLSVIVPAYDEQERLPVMMDETMEYLMQRKKVQGDFTFEVIIVDDGSRDATSQVGLDYTERYGGERVRVLTLVKNKGKGGAVRMGMLSARGRVLLFADADGATKFSDLDRLEKKLKELTADDENVMAVVCGSRAHLEKDAIAQRSFFRTVLMFGFHFLVWFLCVRGVRDTQCGYKLMSREAARVLFTNLHVERWAFDVDLLYIAQTLNFKLAEVAVTWHEIEGSKITPFWSWMEMGRDLLLIRLRYFLGAWTITKPSKDR